MIPSRPLCITGATFALPDGVQQGGTLLCENGKIEQISSPDFFILHEEAEFIDGDGLIVLPGFIDVHVHGGGGADTMNADSDGLKAMLRSHATHGTTGLLFTTMTQSGEKITSALACAAAACGEGAEFCPEGAQPLGIHLEGPYISPARPGAQPKEYVRPYDSEEFAGWLQVSQAQMRLITMAPEQPRGGDLIDACRAANIVVSLGHTDTDSAGALAALDRGASHATHLFNAMPSIHHRKPGPIPVLLTDPRAKVELICDGFHVAPEIVRMAYAAKGPEGIIAITDGIAGAGMGDGIYDLGGQPVTVTGGQALLADGTLAGSVLTMDRAARHVREWLNLGDRWDILARLTATNAADQMDWPDRGRLEPGCAADLVLVDSDLNVHATVVGGRVIYRRSAAA